MSYNRKAIVDALSKMNKAKKPKQVNDIIMDPEGQNKFPGIPTRIPSDNITMETTPYPVLGVDNFGNEQMMYPGANYIFPGADYVDEYPMMQIGGESTIENPPTVLPRSTINEYYNFRRANLIDLSLTPEQAREKYTSVNPVLFDAYTFFKNKGWTPVDSSTYHDEDFRYCSSKGCFYDDNSWNTFISANSPAETPIVERPLVTPETSNVQTPEQPPILPVIPLENVPQQVVTPQQPVPTQTPPQQPVQTNQPQVTPAPQQPSETPKSSEPKPKYHKEYNPYTGKNEPMSPKQKIELDRLYSRDLPMPENWQPELIETYRRQSGGVTDWKSRIASAMNFQKGGQLSKEEFEKRKAAYKKMTGRDFEPPKSFKQSPQAREYYQNKYNQQPVIQSQPSETVQQSTGMTADEAEQLKIQNTPSDPRINQFSFEKDNRDPYTQKRDQYYAEQITDPTGWNKVGRYIDAATFIGGNLGNTIFGGDDWKNSLQNFEAFQLNPYNSEKDKLLNRADMVLSNVGNAFIDIGTAELGFVIPQLYKASFKKLLEIGSKANQRADVLQGVQGALDLFQGDASAIGDILLNVASYRSKMDNFDASTVYHNLNNWNKITKAEKIDTAKDIFNLFNAVYQQSQRTDPMQPYPLYQQGGLASQFLERAKQAQQRDPKKFAEETRKLQMQKFRKDMTAANMPKSMAEAEAMIESGELKVETIAQQQAREKREADARKKEREAALEAYEKRVNTPGYNAWTGLPGESWRDMLAAEAAPLAATFRFSQGDNFIDDYINPAVWIGSMAQNLGESPQQAKETGSLLPYITSVGTPLLGGAMAGIGAKNTGQFVNNIVNPFAGMNPLKSKQLPGSPNVISSVDDVVFVPRSQSTYKFPTSRIKTESDVIHPANLAFEPENIINKEVHTFLKKNNVDVKGLPESYLWAKNGTDYVLPEGVNHDILNEYARLHHTRDKTLEFKKVAEALEKLNPGIKISSSHDLHAVASNIPYSKWWGSKATSSADDVGRGLTQTPQPWQMQELPGLHLKSTMEGEVISKIVEPKTGLINTEQALAIIGKESGGADKVALIRQGLGDNIPKKMDYNEFRKVVQDQLIPLERQFVAHSSDYGIYRLGYKEPEFITRNVDGKTIHEMTSDVIENQTLILGNKNKFGRGSSAHGNPDETLGHAHFLRDAETPDVLTVTQIQSDAFQGTHRTSMKTKEQAKFNYDRQLEYYNKNKDRIERINKIQKLSKSAYENMFSGLDESLALSKADLENFTQKQLLDKNHQERYLQELVDYAGKRGDVNKMRVPTSETAAKVQGYERHNPMSSNFEYSDKYPKELNDLVKNVRNSSRDNYDDAVEKLNIYIKNNKPNFLYSSEHQTILKKYAEQPKIIKKLFGKEPTIVTDSKGNTWYEFDIPDKFKKGKGEIKAFGLAPLIGIGAAGAAASQYQEGGTTEEELTPAQLAMMKARLAYAHMHGNPSAQRMVAPVDNPYIFTGTEPYASPDTAGYSGTHYMFSQGPFAVPTIQTGPDGQLYYNVNASPNDSEAMQFDSPEDAEVFARYYKTVAPAFQDMELTDEEIEEYKRGGCTIVKL